MPLLLRLYPDEPPAVIASISLAVVCLNALSGTMSYARMRRVNYRAGLIFAAAAVPGSILGAYATALLPRRQFDICLGIVLVAVAVFLLVKPTARPQNGNGFAQGGSRDRDPVEIGPWTRLRFNRALAVSLSAVVGFLSTMLGIGGGIIHVPALVYLLGFPVHFATATSHFVLAIMAGSGSLVHILTGAFHVGVRRTICLGIGVMLGAPLGARLSKRVHGTWIVRCLAAALALVSLRLLLLP